MEKEFIRDATRELSLFDIKAWHQGHSSELQNLIGTGFFNHLFISEKGVVTLYYDNEEGEIFHSKLKELLNSDSFFDELCTDFFKLTEQINNVKSNQEVHNLQVKMMPAITIFDEIDNYPEIASDSIKRRLMRVRTTTQEASYVLAKKANINNQPKDFIFFKGSLYLKSE